MSQIVDLRSDTVTRPTPEMREAMMTAELGDDVLGDDPTVIALEAESAKVSGKEAAVFVPSGTMGNQIAVASHTQPGDAIAIEEEAHILYYEVGAPAVLSGVVSWTVPSSRGLMAPEALEARMRRRNLHTPGTSLVCLENTHNRAGGTIVPTSYMAIYREIADRFGAKVHLDGARVFNAAVALGIPMAEIAQYADSVNFCLSKGLRAPIGSVLCGSAELIDKARFWRKRLGGGMRQAGIIAAAGLYSLQHYVDRLAEDHARARRFAMAVAEIPGLTIDLETVQTNMALVQTPTDAADWQERLHAEGIWCFAVASHRLRFVFHADVDDAGADRAVEVLKSLA
jgi:threonine aldolase